MAGPKAQRARGRERRLQRPRRYVARRAQARFSPSPRKRKEQEMASREKEEKERKVAVLGRARVLFI